MNFVVVSSVGIMRVDCTHKYCNETKGSKGNQVEDLNGFNVDHSKAELSVAGHPRLLALSSFVCAVNSYTVNLFYNDTPYNDIVHFDYKIHMQKYNI